MKKHSYSQGWGLGGRIAVSRLLQPSFLLAPGLVFGMLSAASAQILNDPTRPPAGINAPEAAEGASARGPVLQSVKISRTEKSAIINGEMVKLGAKYGEARVIRISENEVALRSANGIEILRMYPGVEIKPVKPASSVRQPTERKGGTPATNTRRKDG